MKLNPYQKVYTAPIGSAGGSMDIAFADISGSGDHDPTQDVVIFERGANGSGSAVTRDRLKFKVNALGGRATARQLSGLDDGQAQEIGSRSKWGKPDAEGPRWTSFSAPPPGLNHPIVDYVFRTDGDQLFVDYVVQEKARILPSTEGDPHQVYAGVDFNGDGQVDPAQDSLLMLHVYQSGTNPRQVETGVSYGGLKDALTEAGGQADGETIAKGVAAKTSSPFIQPENITQAGIMHFPERLHGDMPDDVERSYALTEDGGIEVSYHLKQR